ncbi:MAG: GerAB/ArcD/ProY family transporter, partial [Anaerotignum sp.]|nr:GerAB/ArcD/ProY family transporter [Anaerotignum sp.]
MFAENRKVSLRQLQILLLLDCFGTAVLFIPAELAQISGRACWTLAAAGGLFFVAATYLLITAGRRLKGTVADWCRSAFGYLPGTLIVAALALKILFDGVLELRIFSEIICRSMLPNTPVWVISLVILSSAGALAVQGAECRGRAAEILFFIVGIPLVAVLAAVLVSAEYGRTMPMELPAPMEMGNGVLAMSIIFQGLTFLYFVFPQVKKKEGVSEAALVSTLITTALIAVIVFLSLAVFGEGVLSEKLLPALQMMERVSFTGIFLTRQDILLLWFWMASVCIFLSGVLSYSVFLGMRIFRRKEGERRKWIWSCLAVIFVLSLLP